MALILSSHAKARLRERGITEAQVKSVLEAPEITYPDKIKGRMVKVKRLRGRRLKIVVMEHKGDVFVITAVWTGGGEST